LAEGVVIEVDGGLRLPLPLAIIIVARREDELFFRLVVPVETPPW
jgi:hypothetical protein